MNKKSFSFLGMAAALLTAGLSSCSEEQTLAVGEGTMYISTRVNSDVMVESRASTEEELAESTIVWIYSDEGVVRKYNGMANVPNGIKLVAGTYTVKAWAGKLEYASFESRWFEGQEVVEVKPDQPKAVEVECKITNVVASVKYPDNVDELISNYSLTVSHKGGSLTFEGRDERKGYYIMPDDVNTLDYVLTFTTDGKEKTVRGTIANVQPAHEYVLNVIADDKNGTADGAAFITIEVDDTMIEVKDDILITTPPVISGYGFDINVPVAGESGSIGRKSVYASAAANLRDVILANLPMAGDLSEVNLVRAEAATLADLAGKGITFEVTNVDGGQMMKVVFEDTYLNALPNSDEPYVINITATDEYGKSSSAALTLRVTEAPVVTAPMVDSDVSYVKATLSGTVAKEGVEAVGFEYAPAGSTDWTYVAGSTSRAFTKGQAYYATVTGLEMGTKYVYRAVAGDGTEVTYRADEQEFSTLTPPQLPNSGMEQWGKVVENGKDIVMPMNNGADGWDTGNHGSGSMGVQLTQSHSDVKHGGAYSARLRSQFVGLGGLVGKFAAGNLFYGKYIKTDGTDGVIGFGRPFDMPNAELKVTKVRLWVSYQPATVVSGNNKGSGDHLSVGATDQGHIFVALFDGPDNGDTDSGNNGKYGYVVRTKKSGRRLFDKNAVNVAAYGEKIFTEAYGDGSLQMLEIPLEYYAGKGNPTHIAVVCTASRYGDYFEGGEGSTMIIDDVELVYEAR